MSVCTVCGKGDAMMPDGRDSPRGDPPAHTWCREAVRREAQRTSIMDDEVTQVAVVERTCPECGRAQGQAHAASCGAD